MTSLIKFFCLFSSFFIVGVVSNNNLSPHFVDWMRQHLNADEVRGIIRNELTTGSFGGGEYNGNRRPVILVHGMNNEASSLWKVRRDLVASGYPSERIFATSWGGPEKNYLDFNVKLDCRTVLFIRRFIQIVHWYTGVQQVDVIAYSMGAPLTRKALLGGHCAENKNVYIGGPMTNFVHTFISVAGANKGTHLCGFPFFAICNRVNGLSCGSKFLKDINSKRRYEATSHIYNLASTGDAIVGYWACGTKASAFDGAKEWKIDMKSHTETEFDTGNIQYKMLMAGY